ncbi:glycosyl hydrolase family 28-related protein [Spirosoma spitsbergense]|uniref:glycosyl hydrolase family 28-related protein n=1 Tax=Spirosoma spitsbergense TaxID=431554 RepID=UPI00037D496A|nr:glycosyl hydrolase family 28-related protein [Spirosoma spitsbergense]
MINVKDYGAFGDGGHDDTAAIQNAINFAKSQSYPTGGGTYQISVFFPAGFYYITAPINITNAVGIWLMGDGGKYISTSIIGVTGRSIFDFSGSSVSGCENFTFLSNSGNGAGRSTIGVQFALTSNGGLNCGIRNCYFQLQDFPTANGGYGTIGILGVRSEEFYIHECLIRANVPVILSNTTQLNLSGTGATFTASSTYQTLSAGTGSMGVLSLQALSLQNYEKRQPALILNGTNSLSFQGYLSRLTGTTGSNETAILCNQYTTNMRIHATIESFSQVIRATNGGFEGNEITVVSSSVTTPTAPLVDVTGCTIRGLKLRISLPISAERDNRYVVYYAPDANANQPSAGSIIDSEITCYDISSNQYIISPNLLKNSANVVFNTSIPFEKKGGRSRQLSNSKVGAGTVGSPTSAAAFRFLQADNPASTNGRGGYYRVWLDGVIQAGSYGSAYGAVLSFQAQIIVNQNYLGILDLPSATVIILDKSVTNPSFIDINGVIVDINFNNRIGTVTVTPRMSGSSTGEPVNYEGYAEVQSDFLVYDVIPL